MSFAYEISYWKIYLDGCPVVREERVSVKGSIDFIAALKAKNVPFECHIFPEGKHGLGITKANQVEGTKQWFMLYVDWLKRLGY